MSNKTKKKIRKYQKRNDFSHYFQLGGLYIENSKESINCGI